MGSVKRKLTDFTPDLCNANKGTVRGLAMLEDSLRKYGAGRSILVDKHNRIIAGNKTAESAVDIGLTEAIVVPTDGKQLVVVQRTDIDLDTPQGRELAIADNRVGELDLAWSADELSALANDGVDLSQFFNDGELAHVLNMGDELDYQRAWQGMPEFDNPDALGAYASVKVHIANEADLIRFAALMEQTVSKETKWIWFPKRADLDLKGYRVKDES